MHEHVRAAGVTLGVNAEDEMGCMLKRTLLRMQACTLRPRKPKAEFVSGVSVRYSEIPTVIDFHQSPMIHIPRSHRTSLNGAS